MQNFSATFPEFDAFGPVEQNNGLARTRPEGLTEQEIAARKEKTLQVAKARIPELLIQNGTRTSTVCMGGANTTVITEIKPGFIDKEDIPLAAFLLLNSPNPPNFVTVKRNLRVHI